ncbi:MAG: energy-coupled thiamine transporter ThiT [Clostridia bacterium]|nr:energy-coupled thiamine transporter ThiT [Clostridia bacterium]
MKLTRTRILAECAILLSFATVLSLFKIVDLPYGGSVTVASMLPVAIIAYRHGLGYGLLSGALYGVVQQLLGLKTLSYVTTWQSILAVILLDYVVAFMVIGVAGIFRKPVGNQAAALTLGALLACLLRYACHVISGATVWAGLSIPTAGALIYSFAYNATYMLPETIVLAAAAYYIGSSLDFTAAEPVRIVRRKANVKSAIFAAIGGLFLTAALTVDVAAIFRELQNAETGEWNLAGLASVNWILVAAASAAGACGAAVFFLLAGKARAKETQSE